MKILIIGHFGGRNIGDELILLSQMQLLQEKFDNPEFLIFSYDEEFTKQTYSKYGYKIATVKAFGLRTSITSIINQIKKIKNIDFAIIGGGGLIQDVYFSYGTFRYLIPVYICLLRNIPVYSFSLGVYQFKYKYNKLLFKEFLKYSSGISVRDSISKKNIETISSIREIYKIPDSALLFDLEKLVTQKIEIKKETPCITLIIRDFFEPYIENIGQIIEYVMENLNIELVKIIVFENNPRERELANSMKNFLHQYSNKVSIIDDIDPIQYILTLDSSEIVISGRLHGILPSIILQKKLICMSYAPKINSFCEEHGYSYLTFSDLENINKVCINDYIIPFSSEKEHSINREAINSFLTYIKQTYKIDALQINYFIKVKLLIKLIYMGSYLLLLHVLHKFKKIKIYSE